MSESRMSRADSDSRDRSAGDRNSDGSSAPSGGSESSDGRVVDETWKDEARREKEKLAGEPDPHAMRELPEASFLGLVEELSLRVMFALGQIPNPVTGTQEIDLPAAKYTIDLLGVLEEKTRGNLSQGESEALVELLQRLRLSFVQYSRQPPSGAPTGNEESGGETSEESGPRIIV